MRNGRGKTRCLLTVVQLPFVGVLLSATPDSLEASGGSGRYLMKRTLPICAQTLTRGWTKGEPFNERLLAIQSIDVSLAHLFRSFQFSPQFESAPRLPIHFIAFELEGHHRLAFWNMNERDLAHTMAWDLIQEAAHGRGRILYAGIMHLSHLGKGVFSKMELSDFNLSFRAQSERSRAHLQEWLVAFESLNGVLPDDLPVEILWADIPPQTIPLKELKRLIHQ